MGKTSRDGYITCRSCTFMTITARIIIIPQVHTPNWCVHDQACQLFIYNSCFRIVIFGSTLTNGHLLYLTLFNHPKMRATRDMVPKMLGKKNYSISFHPLMNRHLPVKMGIYICIYINPLFPEKTQISFQLLPQDIPTISPLWLVKCSIKLKLQATLFPVMMISDISSISV